MSMVLIVLIVDFGSLHHPLLWRTPAGSTSYYFDPYPPDEILPTPLPNEWSCWGCCCLFPLAGGIIGYNVLKEKPTKLKKKRLNFGINYGLGSAITLKNYQAVSGEIVIPMKVLYWVNLLDLSIGYNFCPSWELEAGLSYMWGRETDRSSIFRTSQGAVIGGDWNISAFVPTLSTKIRRKSKFLSIGLELYFAKGINHSFIRKGSYPSEFEAIVVTTKGIGPGIFICTGVGSKISSKFQLYLSAAGRIGVVRNPQYRCDKSISIEKEEDYYHSFTGIYLNVGIRYLVPMGG
ncbi:hypothetical protein DRP53_05400 [candidate division WOR-3 bacterium]|uniref:Outer membrane protein beta-barrel domain-containing protein n=1 Tax=candidate division WOR-3 bacterium TaxID=2052148 RepID=A0A660SHV8_UNCW3|nr:MAG: hypothetical protein DRP53_05400 [candidate division WOR-3 bacterium]